MSAGTLPSVMVAPTCPSCGREVEVDAHTCADCGTALVVVAAEPTRRLDALIGATLGEYKVQRRIGMGGMGVVYEALQPVIGKRVAVKVLRPDIADSASEMKRLLEEARTVNAIGHRGIIDVFSFGQTPDGRQYFVMELLAGHPLDELIQQRAPMSLAESLPILVEICEALTAVHAKGVVHRDLKPSNIFVVSQGSTRFIKILDFGLARQSHQAPSGKTRASAVVGTPEFIAPEQARGLTATARSDLYALGVIAFEMLTGRLPFEAPSALEMMMRHVDTVPPRVRDLVPALSSDIDDLVAQLLAKDPAARPASAELVQRTLKRIERAQRGAETQVGARQLLGDTEAATTVPTARASPMDAPTPKATPELTVPPATTDAEREQSQTTARIERKSRAWVGLAVGGAAVFALVGLALVSLRESREPDVKPLQLNPALTQPKPKPSGPLNVMDPNAQLPGTGAASEAHPLMPPPTQQPRLPQVETRAPEPVVIDARPPPREKAPSRRSPQSVKREAEPPPPAPPAFGTLTLVNTAWCDVEIDGKPMGRAPPTRVFPGLSQGLHHVTLIRGNGEKEEHDVAISGGSPNPLKVPW